MHCTEIEMTSDDDISIFDADRPWYLNLLIRRLPTSSECRFGDNLG